jgi:lysozyme
MHHRLRLARPVLVALLVGTVAVPALPALTGSGSVAFAKTTPAPSYLGPDVSSYQHPTSAKYPKGKPINWASVAKAGKTFAIVKATESTNYVNPFFKTDYNGAKTAGLVQGSYHFARPALPIVSSAQAQAEFYAKTIGDVTGADTLPPALDLEVTGGLTPPQLVTWAQVFLYKLKALTGRVPMLYTYPNFWSTALTDPGAFKRFPLWMAAYGTSTAPDADLWQYTDSSSITGISGGVDQSRYLSTSELPWETLSNAAGSIPMAWPTTAPSPPHNVSAVPGPTTTTVAWLPGSDGSSRVTSYVVTATVAGQTASNSPAVPSGQTATVNGSTDSATVSGLDPTQVYTFTVTATSADGTSNPSTPSHKITPVVPTALTSTVPATVIAGRPVTISGNLSQSGVGTGLSKQTITLYRRTIGTTAWVQRATSVTGDTGTAQIVLKPTRSSTYKLVFAGSPGYLPTSVISKPLAVAPAVTAALSVLTVKHGHTATLSGLVTPALAGQIVTREALVKGVWKVLGTTTTDKTGAYSFMLHPAHKQKDRQFRVLAAATAQRSIGTSPVVSLVVT